MVTSEMTLRTASRKAADLNGGYAVSWNLLSYEAKNNHLERTPDIMNICHRDAEGTEKT